MFYAEKDTAFEEETGHQDQFWQFGIEIKNTGNTPASISNISVKQGGIGRLAFTLESPPIGALTVGGKDVLKVRLSDLLVPGDIVRDSKRSSVLLPELWASFSYRDVFGASHEGSAGCTYAFQSERIFEVRCVSSSS